MASYPAISFSHSHHLLSVKECGVTPDVLSFEGQESLSEPFRYRIEFTCSDHHLDKQKVLLKSASLTLQAAVMTLAGIAVQQPLRVIQGVVAGFERLGTSKDETRYALTLAPRLALLQHCSHNAIYLDMSVPQIVEKILRERHGMRGQDFLFSLSREYPRREQVMQYGEDDLHFITRLLGETGIWFRFSADTRLHIDVVEFCDSRQQYQQAITLPSVPPSGQHANGTDAVWAMQCRHQVAVQQVSTRDYNYRQANQPLDTVVNISAQDPTTYGEAYHYADNFLQAGDPIPRDPVTETGAFYARLRHERYLNQQTCVSALTSSPALSPGQVLKVTGGNEVDPVFAEGTLITTLSCSARRDRDFQVRLTGIPDSILYSFRPVPGAHPVMAGTLPARITSTTVNDPYGHIDKQGRYRISLQFDREERQAGFESLWVRLARPYAGDTFGLHLPLLAGTEVAIAFENGHPDRPYISSVLHDSAHQDLVTIQNYKRNVLRTPANNKIRLDDERGKEHIKVSTEYGGKSQLNLGHLVDEKRQPRGEGFELRTDSWGAIRAQKGLFISADGQAKAQGQVLAMEQAISQLQLALNQVEALSGAVETAKAELADIQTQKILLEQGLTDLKQSALLLSAPEGISQSTPKSVQLSAGENVISTSGKHTDFSALKRFTVAAGESVSLFAQKLGIKMFASRGKVEIQAQGDEMTLDALKDIRISSSQGKLVISAKQEIILTSGGGYIRIADGVVECAAPDKIIQRAAVWQKFGGQSLSVAAQSWENADFSYTPKAIHAYDGSALPAQKLAIQAKDAASQTVSTSEDGKGVLMKQIDIVKDKMRFEGGE
ncbi:type VI secretion system Vgr family protein [Tatumella saanichensis]|uniref:type VI secretion system Vgr family protein n=1 Tax=Tatumella saanichensis TaxID=480813 RepID=UPI0004A41657|nr:type VI secretion system Vgr family protein [Tatumella saanichensis]